MACLGREAARSPPGVDAPSMARLYTFRGAGVRSAGHESTLLHEGPRMITTTLAEPEPDETLIEGLKETVQATIERTPLHPGYPTLAAVITRETVRCSASRYTQSCESTESVG